MQPATCSLRRVSTFYLGLLFMIGCSSQHQTATDAGGDHPTDARFAVRPCTTDASSPDADCTSRVPVDASTSEVPDAGGADRPDCISTPEICDGKDNDCDGVVDNGFKYQGSPVGGICYSSGFGACITMGHVVCVSPSAAGCMATPGVADETFHTTAAPNGSWDWNCNNNVDRKYPLAACESFTSSTCPAQGWQPPPGEAGDCGRTLLQQTCVPTQTGCAASGDPIMVTEACK